MGEQVQHPGGALVLVGTPIGNLGDLSPRGVQALAGADVVACEDTRRTGRLLEAAGIRARRLVVVNDHTEAEAAGELVALMQGGQRVALVTDAGMPSIADPGERLVRAAIEADVRVEAVPGPSSVVAAVALSGLGTGRFVFEGFLPRKGAERTTRLRELAAERRTIVLFESPHRVARTLADLAEAFEPERQVAICRELTKLHEEVWRGALAEAAAHTEDLGPRGEHVLVVEGAPQPEPADDDQIRRALASEREAGVSNRDAVDRVSTALGVSRRRVYELAIAAG